MRKVLSFSAFLVVGLFIAQYLPAWSGSDYSTVSNRVFLHLKKFDDVKRATMNEEKGTRDWVCFRAAEAYLLAGEAYYRAGDVDNALKYINTSVSYTHLTLPTIA